MFMLLVLDIEFRIEVENGGGFVDSQEGGAWLWGDLFLAAGRRPRRVSRFYLCPILNINSSH